MPVTPLAMNIKNCNNNKTWLGYGQYAFNPNKMLTYSCQSFQLFHERNNVRRHAWLAFQSNKKKCGIHFCVYTLGDNCP